MLRTLNDPRRRRPRESRAQICNCIGFHEHYISATSGIGKFYGKFRWEWIYGIERLLGNFSHALYAITHQVHVAAAYLGMSKKPYLMAALEELYPVWTMAIFDKGLLSTVCMVYGVTRTSSSDPIVPKFPTSTYNGIMTTTASCSTPYTTVICGGTEVTAEFLTAPFSLDENEESKWRTGF